MIELGFFEQNYDEFKMPKSNRDGKKGFRKSQLGALYAIGSHFSNNLAPGIVTMPTGSGKTAVIMSAPFILDAKRVLVLTPSRLVRGQIAKDFRELKTLFNIGALKSIHGEIRVKEIENIVTKEDIEELSTYNVIVSTPYSIKKSKEDSIDIPTDLFDLVIADEAHHSAADIWKQILDYFHDAKQILFTATPYRRDNKEIKGKFLYSYTMTEAYKDGIYGEILFIPVESKGNPDIALAMETEAQFRLDEEKGLNHCVMVRTATKKRATELEDIYAENTKLKLLKIDSDVLYSDVKDIIEKLKEGTIDGIICVDMLGEGFDFPNLKIAAVHAPHKSLEVTLQFIGRFTRTNASNLGQAKFIAIPSEIEIAAEKIYNSDAIWSKLIPHMSDSRLEKEVKNRQDIEKFHSVRSVDELKSISLGLFKPFTHSKIYDVYGEVNLNIVFNEYENLKVVNEFRDNQYNSIVYLLRQEIKPKWVIDKTLVDTSFQLIILFYDEKNKIVHINSTVKQDELYEVMINKIVDDNKYKKINSNQLKRVYRNISNLEFFNIGLKSGMHSKNKEDYRIIAGPEVNKAITPDYGKNFFRGHSVASGIDKNNGKVTLGYSAGSKVWSNSYLNIPEYLEWCVFISKKIRDVSDFKTGTEFDFVPDTIMIDSFPGETSIIAAIWDLEVYLEDNVVLLFEEIGYAKNLSELTIDIIGIIDGTNCAFTILDEIINIEMVATMTSKGIIYSYANITDTTKYSCYINDLHMDLCKYLKNNQLTFYLNNFAAICNNEYFQKDMTNSIVKEEWFEKNNWKNYNIEKEFRKDISDVELSIQDYVDMRLKTEKVDYCYYDHGTGEIADFISGKVENEKLIITLYHCKSAGGKAPGNRVGDLYEVCSQVIKSSIWLENSILKDKLINRIGKNNNDFGFRQDSIAVLEKLLKKVKNNVSYQLVIVQPGIENGNLERKMEPVIAACNEFCVGNGYEEIKIWCS